MKIDKNKVEQLKAKWFKVNGVEVDYRRNLIRIEGKDKIVQPMVMELVVLLCSHKGETLLKSDIVAHLWPDTIVGPDSLANTMARLRKMLNDDVKAPTYIETVQRKGYRWLQDIERQQEKIIYNKKFILVLVAITFMLTLFASLTKDAVKMSPTEFLFPELSITKLPDGGYEVNVAIDGELTEERKAAVLQEIKRITGEENSGMEFTFDSLTPECVDKDDQKKNCKYKNKEH
ncbi:MAG: winged helix-turn-helix domain-containing protein [Thalassotalea sp.]|nr:winged helix-turn-helix domain-containing protein [Thalassotalea sp.]